ncbi:MAG: hypothetical protein ACREU7_14575 [Burkholderiales bacterium]
MIIEPLLVGGLIGSVGVFALLKGAVRLPAVHAGGVHALDGSARLKSR